MEKRSGDHAHWRRTAYGGAREKRHWCRTAGDAIFPGLSVRKHLECGAHTKSAWRNRRQRIEEIFEVFPHLRNLQHSLVGKLSGGERRMVSVGRMLMSEARLYLIDEPSLGLAPKISQRVMEALWALPVSGR